MGNPCGTATIEHGGDLHEARRRFGEPDGGWIDLSTGINPNPFPFTPPPAVCWQRLPEDGDGLAETAAAVYGAPRSLPVPGSQAAISWLPALWPPSRVAIHFPEYGEHAAAWGRAGHRVDRISRQRITDGPGADDPWRFLVLSNPGNPLGTLHAPDTLRAWRTALEARGGALVVDEAFMDAQKEALSLAPEAGGPGLVVLRSLGKFYGLAGARLGFALAEPRILEPLAARLGPWPVAGPTRTVALQALRDENWRAAERHRLTEAAARLDGLLAQEGWTARGACPLFRWVAVEKPAAAQSRLAQGGVWTRRFDDPPGLRIGLPGPEEAWQRLIKFLKSIAR